MLDALIQQAAAVPLIATIATAAVLVLAGISAALLLGAALTGLVAVIMTRFVLDVDEVLRPEDD